MLPGDLRVRSGLLVDLLVNDNPKLGTSYAYHPPLPVFLDNSAGQFQSPRYPGSVSSPVRDPFSEPAIEHAAAVEPTGQH